MLKRARGVDEHGLAPPASRRAVAFVGEGRDGHGVFGRPPHAIWQLHASVPSAGIAFSRGKAHSAAAARPPPARIRPRVEDGGEAGLHSPRRMRACWAFSSMKARVGRVSSASHEWATRLPRAPGQGAGGLLAVTSGRRSSPLAAPTKARTLTPKGSRAPAVWRSRRSGKAAPFTKAAQKAISTARRRLDHRMSARVRGRRGRPSNRALAAPRSPARPAPGRERPLDTTPRPPRPSLAAGPSAPVQVMDQRSSTAETSMLRAPGARRTAPPQGRSVVSNMPMLRTPPAPGGLRAGHARSVALATMARRLHVRRSGFSTAWRPASGRPPSPCGSRRGAKSQGRPRPGMRHVGEAGTPIPCARRRRGRCRGRSRRRPRRDFGTCVVWPPKKPARRRRLQGFDIAAGVPRERRAGKPPAITIRRLLLLTGPPRCYSPANSGAAPARPALARKSARSPPPRRPGREDFELGEPRPRTRRREVQVRNLWIRGPYMRGRDRRPSTCRPSCWARQCRGGYRECSPRTTRLSPGTGGEHFRLARGLHRHVQLLRKTTPRLPRRPSWRRAAGPHRPSRPARHRRLRRARRCSSPPPRARWVRTPARSPS